MGTTILNEVKVFDNRTVENMESSHGWKESCLKQGLTRGEDMTSLDGQISSYQRYNKLI